MNNTRQGGAIGYGFSAVFGVQGRIGRVQFGVSIVYQTLLSAAVGALMVIFVGGPMLSGSTGLEDISSLVAFTLVGLVAELATTSLLFFSVRARLNDIGISNWWTMPMAVPTLVWLTGAAFFDGLTAEVMQSIGGFGSTSMLVLLFAWPGTEGANAYGAPPRSPRAGGLLTQRPPALS